MDEEVMGEPPTHREERDEWGTARSIPRRPRSPAARDRGHPVFRRWNRYEQAPSRRSAHEDLRGDFNWSEFYSGLGELKGKNPHARDGLTVEVRGPEPPLLGGLEGGFREVAAGSGRVVGCARDLAA